MPDYDRKLSHEKGAVASSLGSAIRGGHFTPFLGAGASSLRSRKGLTTGYWLPVAYQLRTLQDKFKGSEPEYCYVTELAHAKGLKLASAENPGRPPRHGQELLLLQQSLTSLGAHLVACFARSMLATGKPVVNVQAYEVPLEDDPALLPKYFLPALDAAHELAVDAEHMQNQFLTEHLNPAAIHKGLQRLVLRVAGRTALSEAGKSLDQHEKLKKAVADPQGLPEHGSLSLDELAWLANLLWHTLRFEVEAYPTGSELAFRIGLEVDLHPHYAELAQAAQAWKTDDDHIQLIRQWFKFWRDSPELQEFHQGLAAALTSQHRRHKVRAKPSADGRGFSPSGAGGAKLATRPLDPEVSIAITSNYDRCLENAFDFLRLSYHVVFPVNDADTWMVRTKCWDECGLASSETWGELHYSATVDPGKAGGLKVRYPQGSEYRDLDLKGPIIVKIHGSPLDVPPDAPDDFRPFLVLSEKAYLMSVSSPSKLPDWVQKQIGHDGREIWFLGYSISDWNVRLTLYRQVRMTHIDHYGEDPDKYAVDRHVDDWGIPLLQDLKVQMYVGDLDEFGDILLSDATVAAVRRDRGNAVGADR